MSTAISEAQLRQKMACATREYGTTEKSAEFVWTTCYILHHRILLADPVKHV